MEYLSVVLVELLELFVVPPELELSEFPSLWLTLFDGSSVVSDVGDVRIPTKRSTTDNIIATTVLTFIFLRKLKFFIKYCKFKCKEDDELLDFASGTGDEEITLNLVGKCSMNTYGGSTTAQFIIDDYEVTI